MTGGPKPAGPPPSPPAAGAGCPAAPPEPGAEAPLAAAPAGGRDPSRWPAVPLEDHTGHLVRRAHQRATALFQQAFEGIGVTPTQFAILSSLVRHGALPQTVLSRVTAIDTATLSPMLGRLTEMGLVRRRASSRDQRVNLVDVTAEGRALVRRMLPVSDQVSAAVLDPVPVVERPRFVELLRRIGTAPESPET